MFSSDAGSQSPSSSPVHTGFSACGASEPEPEPGPEPEPEPESEPEPVPELGAFSTTPSPSESIGSGSAVMRGETASAVKRLPKRSERIRTRTRVGLFSASTARSPAGTTTRMSRAVPSVCFANTARLPSGLNTTAFLFLPRLK